MTRRSRTASTSSSITRRVPRRTRPCSRGDAAARNATCGATRESSGDVLRLMARVALTFLGGFDARVGGKSLALAKKVQALVAYVTLKGGAVSRAELAS